MVTGKRSLDVFGVGVCVVEQLLGVTVGIFRLGGATRMGMLFIEGKSFVITRVVSGETENDSGEG